MFCFAFFFLFFLFFFVVFFVCLFVFLYVWFCFVLSGIVITLLGEEGSWSLCWLSADVSMFLLLFFLPFCISRLWCQKWAVMLDCGNVSLSSLSSLSALQKQSETHPKIRCSAL